MDWRLWSKEIEEDEKGLRWKKKNDNKSRSLSFEQWKEMLEERG
jgi:hypothetical protein